MNSANRVMPKSARKIHSDQNPRRLARKLRSRRRTSGLSLMPSTRLSSEGVASGAATTALDLSTLKIDPRIGHDVHEIADQVEQQAEQREEVERTEHHRIVAVDRGFEAQQAEPV